jgi:phosphoglycolate phosphatase
LRESFKGSESESRVVLNACKEKRRMKPYIIWDWNGTLLDDVNAAVAALNRMLVKRGLPSTTKEYYREHFGFPVRPFYAELGVDLEHDSWDEICDDFHNFIAEEKDQYLREDAVAALRLVKESGIRQSILSALRQDLLLRDTSKYGVAEYFDFIYGVDNLDGATKLSRGFELLEVLCEEDKRNLFFIGDTLHDAEVAHALGATPILISCGHQTPDRLKKASENIFPSLMSAMEFVISKA